MNILWRNTGPGVLLPSRRVTGCTVRLRRRAMLGWGQDLMHRERAGAGGGFRVEHENDGGWLAGDRWRGDKTPYAVSECVPVLVPGTGPGMTGGGPRGGVLAAVRQDPIQRERACAGGGSRVKPENDDGGARRPKPLTHGPSPPLAGGGKSLPTAPGMARRQYPIQRERACAGGGSRVKPENDAGGLVRRPKPLTHGPSPPLAGGGESLPTAPGMMRRQDPLNRERAGRCRRWLWTMAW